MKVRHTFTIIAAFALISLGGQSVSAQQPNLGDATGDGTSIFGSADQPSTVSKSSDVSRSKMTAAEIRQARALYRSQQRTARLERNLWMGYEPLRPNWNSIPMMSSRYPPRRVIYVPYYVHSR